jgi:3-ketosteroid 9alpha-monooxygenase subunit B
MAEQARVLRVIDETAEAKSFVLELPGEWSYRPGQFLTFRCGEVARSYSLSSSPHTGEEPKITVKRMGDGFGSNWMCALQAGAVLDVLPPGGVFTPASLDRDLLLLAAGSGITPCMSILKSALRQGTGRIALGYANRDEESVIFGEELRSLAAQHDRLSVTHWLDTRDGFPTFERLRDFTGEHPGYEVFACGPDAFMDLAVRAAPGAQVERFTSLAENLFAPREESERMARVTVELYNQTYVLDWPVRTKLLDLLLENNINAPFSCRQATCATCACRLRSGEVKMIKNEILEEEDFAENYILACQSLPLTDEVHVSFD